jgi:succinate dehydrogenase/fumarate reductase flavoprotein subunit
MYMRSKPNVIPARAGTHDNAPNNRKAKHPMPPTTHTCDILIAGSGASGFAAAIAARDAGCDVLMVEKAPQFGGTTCYSAGVIWIPANSHAKRAGLTDSRAQALTYMQSSAGNRLDRARATAFVDTAADVLDTLEAKTHVRYVLAPTWADYEPALDGGADGGRSLAPEPFDGRRLGVQFKNLRPPLESMMLFGGMMIGRNDLPHLFNMTRSAKSALHVAGMAARFGRDRVTHHRGTRLTNGNALIAALALSAFERDIPLWLSSPIIALVRDGDRVIGATVMRDGRETTITAKRGVILACGGFPGDDALKKRLYPHVAAGTKHHSLPPATNSGDGIRVAEGAGAAFNADVHHAAAWTPVSFVPQPDGTTQPFPHFIDRGKPGYMAVDRRGRRFVNEAKSYHVFVPAMIEACRGDTEVACWNICDATAIKRFGLGAAPPFPGRLQPYLKSGYLITGRTPEELARKCGIDPAGLAATIGEWNHNAARSADPAYNRGSDAYQRFNGAANHGRGDNPCVAPLEHAPFYAVKLIPGDIGTFAGLKTDASARVLDATGKIIDGLYAAGNDAASVMGGTYPGAGITIGPALTFGTIAGRHAAQQGRAPA